MSRSACIGLDDQCSYQVLLVRMRLCGVAISTSSLDMQGDGVGGKMQESGEEPGVPVM